MTVEARSFTIAIYLYARGFSPLRAERTASGATHYIFPEKARVALNGYFNACDLIRTYQNDAKHTTAPRVGPVDTGDGEAA